MSHKIGSSRLLAIREWRHLEGIEVAIVGEYVLDSEVVHLRRDDEIGK